MFVLSLARAFGPLLIFIAIVAATALSGLLSYTPAQGLFLFACGFYIGTGVLLAFGLIRLDLPGWRDATRAIDALLEGDPATAQTDQPAQTSPSAHILWQAHAQRMAEQAARLEAPRFARNWAQTDPYYLRYALPLLCVAMLVHAGSDSRSRLWTALTPDPGALFGGHNVHIEAWALPPAYTGRAPLTLKAGEYSTKAPQGSEVTLRISAPGRPYLRLIENGQARKLRPEQGKDGVYEVRTELQHSLSMTLHYWGERARFTLTGIEDRPPEARIVTPPEHADNDRVTLGWAGSDDYGIASAELAIRYQDSEPVFTALPLSALEPESISETAWLDLTRHAFAGLNVSMRIRLTDAAGQAGYSEAVSFLLPEKLFLDPLAKAIIEVRRDILRTQDAYRSGPGMLPSDRAIAPERANRIEYAPDSIKRAGLMLDALTYAPGGHITDTLVFLGMRHVRSALNAALDLPGVHHTENVLWQTALRAEFGNLANARRALDAAAEALEQALRDGAPDAEMQRLLSALREAVQRYLQTLLAQAQTSDQADAGGAGASSMRSDEFENMLQALQDLAETGAHDQARQLLSELSRLLDSLQNAEIRRGSGQGGLGAQTPDNPATDGDNMQGLAGLLRDQRELNDQTFTRSREPEKGQNDLASKQKELAERLQDLRQQMTEDQYSPGIDQQLEEALDAQKQAEQALHEDDNETALAAQRYVAARLREAITELAENADEQSSNPQSASEGRDPLDRAVGGGVDSGDGMKIPDKMERLRAREFLEELRRRSGQPDLLPPEIEYLDRLLRRF